MSYNYLTRPRGCTFLTPAEGQDIIKIRMKLKDMEYLIKRCRKIKVGYFKYDMVIIGALASSMPESFLTCYLSDKEN
jgi:hypothetical protein